MRLTNPWVGYLSRTYESIKESLINRLRVLVPELTDLNESNLLVILASMFSGLVEQLNYYIDNSARESFLGTAIRYSSVVKLVNILDYRIKTRVPATVELYFTYLDSDNLPVEITEPGIIPASTIVTTQTGIQFLTEDSIEVPIGSSYGKVSARQVVRVLGVNLGTTDGTPYQEYIIPGNYAHNSIEITIDSVPWILVRTLSTSLPEDKHFIVQVGEDQIPRITFGNGINGAIPPSSFDIIANYFLTEGAEGNNVNRGTINTITTPLILPNPATQVKVRNNLPPTGGADLESIESIRFNAPLVTKAVERAVTKEDFNYLSRQADGVAKATAIHNCGPIMEVYISPNGGGIASDLLLQDTKDYLDSVRLINTQLELKAAGESPIVLDLVVNPRYKVNVVDLSNEITRVLLERFSFENVEINGRVAVSDIMAAVDNLDRVDTVEINTLYTMPYARPVDHTEPLDWERQLNAGATQKHQWRLVYTGTNFRVFKDGLYLGNVQPDLLYTDPGNVITFKINSSGMYTAGQIWDFTTYPINKTIYLDDNTVPVLTEFTLTVNIINTLV